MLKGLTGQVQRQIFRIDNTFDKAKPLRNKIGCVIGDEDATDIELDVVFRLLGFEQIKGGALRYKQYGTEFQLAFDREMLDREMILPIADTELVGLILKLWDQILTSKGTCRKRRIPRL